MARPRKKGIDYFSVDVNMLNDRKVRRVLRSCGAEGIAVIMQILCLAYSENGYYLTCDSNHVFDISDLLNVDEEYVEKVIDSCIEAELFDTGMHEKHMILTSKRMQKNYKEVIKKRPKPIEIDKRYLLLIEEETELIGEETPLNEVNGSINSINGSINTQSKVK